MIEHAVLQNSWAGLFLLALVLGMKHGMDPDHLATIDGLTRINSVTRPRLSRWAGFLFSLGHGGAVILAAGAIGTLSTHWQVPRWLDDFGAWVSICFLLALGVMNIYMVIRTPARQPVAITGLKGRFLKPLIAHSHHPVLIVMTGALFALSFDTMSQVAFFSVTAQGAGRWGVSIVLGITFMLGMMLTDGLNGMWVAHIIQRADRRALISSRVLGLTVAGLSLGVGGLGLSRQAFPEAVAYVQFDQLQQGLAVVGIILLSFVLALWLSRGQKALVVMDAGKVTNGAFQDF